MPQKKTIVVPALSLVDELLCELSTTTPAGTRELAQELGHLADGDRGRMFGPTQRMRIVAHTLAELRRLGFVRDHPTDDRSIVAWTASNSLTCAVTTTGSELRTWTADVDE